MTIRPNTLRSNILKLAYRRRKTGVTTYDIMTAFTGVSRSSASAALSELAKNSFLRRAPGYSRYTPWGTVQTAYVIA